MSNALQIRETTIAFTPDQERLIRDTIARTADPNEFKLFLYRCQNMGLDPLKPGMIHFVKYGNGPGTIVVGIEGFRSLASRTGMLSGVKRGVIKDEKGNITGAWCEVYRKDWDQPAREEVPFSEYTTGKGPWAKMPETMIKKVAEAAALRMAFPDNLGGIYTQEEMHQAEAQDEKRREYGQRIGLETLPSVQPNDYQPSPEDGSAGHEYRIPFGKWKARGLDQILRDHGPNELANYISYLETTAAKTGKQMRPEVIDFIERSSKALADLENGGGQEDGEDPFL